MKNPNPSSEVSQTTTFEAFPEDVQQAVAARAAQKVRQVYVPPGGLPKVTNPGAGYNPKPKLTQIDDTPEVQAPRQPSIQPQAPSRVQPSPYAATHTPATHTPTMPTADAVSLTLPTNFAYYGFKDIYITPFRGMHLAKLSRGSEEESMLHVVEAVSSVLSTSSGETNLAPKLAINDFYFVLYWLRTNSFTKSQYIHKSFCTNDKHHADVAEGKKLPASLFTTTTITRSSLKTNYLEDMPSAKQYALEYLGVYLHPTTMQDTLDVMEHPEFADEEFQYLAQLASYLRVEANLEATINERLDIVADMSADDISVIRKYEKLMSTIGTVEEINVKCSGCGASSVSKLTLDARNFLPTGEDE